MPVYLSAKHCLRMGSWRYFLNLLPDMVITAVVVVACQFVPWSIENVFLLLIAKAVVVFLTMVVLRMLVDVLIRRDPNLAIKNTMRGTMAQLKGILSKTGR